MKTIFKYPIKIADKTVITLPETAVQLSMQSQDGQITLWCLVDSEEAEKVEYEVYVVGTGNLVPDGIDGTHYQTTIVMRPFVWHIFMKRK